MYSVKSSRHYQLKKRSRKTLHDEAMRVGETVQMHCGATFTIIRYFNSRNMTLRCKEDGTIVDGVTYRHFRDGAVAHPFRKSASVSYNELVVANYLTIYGFFKAHQGSLGDLEGFGSKELDLYNPDFHGRKIAIEYDGYAPGHTRKRDKEKNEACVKNGIHLIRIRGPKTEKYSFKGVDFIRLDSDDVASKSLENALNDIIKWLCEISGKKFKPVSFEKDMKQLLNLKKSFYAENDKVGQRKEMRCGIMAEVIAYRGWNDIDVRFDDGTIVYHKDYSNFKRGSIWHPDLTPRIKLSRLGEIRTMNNGLVAKIIKYKSGAEVTVRFLLDNAITTCRYSNFVKGKVAHPSKSRQQLNCG